MASSNVYGQFGFFFVLATAKKEGHTLGGVHRCNKVRVGRGFYSPDVGESGIVLEKNAYFTGNCRVIFSKTVLFDPENTKSATSSHVLVPCLIVKVWMCFRFIFFTISHSGPKKNYFPPLNLIILMSTPFFHDLNGLNTLTLWKRLTNMKFGSMIYKLWSKHDH